MIHRDVENIRAVGYLIYLAGEFPEKYSFAIGIIRENIAEIVLDQRGVQTILFGKIYQKLLVIDVDAIRPILILHRFCQRAPENVFSVYRKPESGLCQRSYAVNGTEIKAGRIGRIFSRPDFGNADFNIREKRICPAVKLLIFIELRKIFPEAGFFRKGVFVIVWKNRAAGNGSIQRQALGKLIGVAVFSVNHKIPDFSLDVRDAVPVGRVCNQKMIQPVIKIDG